MKFLKKLKKCFGKESSEVDIQLKKREPKFLILGTGESGKSTFFHHVLGLYSNLHSYSSDDCKYLLLITVSQCMLAIYNFVKRKSTDPTSPARFLYSQLSDQAKAFGDNMSSNSWILNDLSTFISNITVLWNELCIQQVVKDYNYDEKFGENLNLLFSNLDRLTSPTYSVCTNDILLWRIRSLGIEETSLSVKNNDISLIDTGGQRCERKKWRHCFGTTNVILYFVSLIEFNCTLRENESVNRLSDSLKTWEEIVNGNFCLENKFALIFSKKDLLTQKLIQYPSISPRDYIPGYRGSRCPYEIIHHLRDLFLSKVKNANAHVPVYVINSLEGAEVTKAIESLVESYSNDNWEGNSGSFAATVWNPQTHKFFSPKLRKRIFCILVMYSSRDSRGYVKYPQSQFYKLPKEILYYIFTHLILLESRF